MATNLIHFVRTRAIREFNNWFGNFGIFPSIRLVLQSTHAQIHSAIGNCFEYFAWQGADASVTENNPVSAMLRSRMGRFLALPKSKWN